MASPSDELLQAQPVIEGKLYFVALRKGPDSLRSSALAASSICYSIDDVLLYEPFFADFGPLNLGKTYRFCKQTHELLQEADRTSRRLYYYCGPHAQNRANAAALIGIFQVIYLNRSADEAYKPLQAFKPYVPFRDASCGVSTFHLTVLDVIKGIQKARDVAFIDWNSGCSAWSPEEYEHYEQVENGDLNWIVPGKLVAFSGPANRGNEIAGYRLHTPEDYWDYYRKRGVTAVVRLNKKVYDRQRFTAGGFRHYDLYFPDGSCPTEAILLKFLEIAESEPGALAIHCKAGLGRTGVLICCYIMKHFRFTAEEVIGYIRVCRPGSVIGPQQNFLRDVEARMWQEGDIWRAAKGINKPHLALEDLSIQGRPAMTHGDYATPSNNHGYGRYNTRATPPSSAGSMASSTTFTTRLSGSSLTSGPTSMQQPVRPRMDSATSLNAAMHAAGEFSKPAQPQPAVLYQQPAGTGVGVAGTGFMGLTVQVPSPAVSCNSNGGSPQSSTASTPIAVAMAQSQRTPPANAAKYAGRSITPLRYGVGGGASASLFTSSGGASVISGYAARTAGTCLSPGSPPTTSPSATRPTAATAPYLRAPSADRGIERASYRVLSHSTSSDRMRTAELERVSSTSSDISMLVGRGAGSLLTPPTPPGALGLSAPIPTTPKPAAPGHRPNAGVARTLAPNGQPRKVPIAMLTQYHANLGHHGGLSSKPAPVHSVSTGGTLVNGDRIKTAVALRYGLQSK